MLIERKKKDGMAGRNWQYLNMLAQVWTGWESWDVGKPSQPTNGGQIHPAFNVLSPSHTRGCKSGQSQGQ